MPLQNHIHLDVNISDTGEKAPVRTWKIRERNVVPSVVLSLQRTLTGHLRRHILSDAGNPVSFRDYQYMIKVTASDTETVEEALDALIGMLGKVVYLVDIVHADNGSDHTGDIKTMVFEEIGDITPINTMLEWYYVAVTLRDGSR